MTCVAAPVIQKRNRLLPSIREAQQNSSPPEDWILALASWRSGIKHAPRLLGRGHVMEFMLIKRIRQGENSLSVRPNLNRSPTFRARSAAEAREASRQWSVAGYRTSPASHRE